MVPSLRDWAILAAGVASLPDRRDWVDAAGVASLPHDPFMLIIDNSGH
ncbi:MAG: hypothetical protein ISQ75_07445 [Puniceicoccaceae bacterium]|nr:hypothetical protein [Puniceicoccaceae bacterium]MBL6912998.1 hypothetical protein [Puniceicoccaceae bacterium]